MHHSHLASGIHVGMACGARNLPSIEYDRNAAWLQLAALATSLGVPGILDDSWQSPTGDRHASNSTGETGETRR
jgi:hypothetical protein